MAKPYIGGQAVLEGVMMRSPGSFVVAVRRADGTIAVREQPWVTLLSGLKPLRWPLLRGALVLFESLHNGFSALKFSAEQAVPQEPGAKPASKVEELASGTLLVLATAVMVGLFIALPHLLTLAASRLFHLGLSTRTLGFHLVDGAFRIAILVGYLLAISRTRDAKRLFQYHGAEHKAIWTYESGLPLTVENAARFTTLHPRCGTSFLFVVVMVSVLLYAVLFPLLPPLSPHERVNQLLVILIKIPLAFPIAGVAYELQRLSAREKCPTWLKVLMLPGMWLQKVTTQEPSAAQLEIALLALGRALAYEEGRRAEPGGVRVYPDFAVALAG